MNVYPINYNPTSDSGPNSFARRLFLNLKNYKDFNISNRPTDADIEFCLIESNIRKISPRITRLDGIYFNKAQDFNLLNTIVKTNYLHSDSVVFQTQFNKLLIESWFGEHKNSSVIVNRADMRDIEKIQPADFSQTFPGKKVWSCASSWRPHKRLNENIRYFIENSDSNTVLLICGKGVAKEDFYGYENLINNRIFYIGHLKWESLISVYKSSSTFIHLSYLDHCPNVVVDAAASGCNIICSSSGGTKEISSLNKKIIHEKEWNFEPVELYKPPRLDFSNFSNISEDNIKTIDDSKIKYYEQMEKIL